MGTIGTALSMSLDGFITGSGEGATAAGLHDWLTAGQIPSRFSPSFTMARPSAEFFDEGIAATGPSSPGAAPTTSPGPGQDEAARYPACLSWSSPTEYPNEYPPKIRRTRS
jgi:hypothetical protein